MLKLQNPVSGQAVRAGYLSDLVPFAAGSALVEKARAGEKVIAPASTLKYVEKSSKLDPLPSDSPHAVPKGSHWVDMTEEGTVLVIEQPEGQTCASIGGIMGLRMAKRGVAGCVVGGRVRDIQELEKTELPVSRAFSNMSLEQLASVCHDWEELPSRNF